MGCQGDSVNGPGRGRKDTLSSFLLLLLSPNSLGKGCGTSWGTGEAAPQGTSGHLQVKVNEPVDHIEEEEGHWENHSRVVIQAIDMDEEAALLPHATLTTAGRAQVLAELVAAARAVAATWVEGLLSWARWALLFITLVLRVLHLTHNIALLLLGTATGTERGKDTATGTRLQWTRKKGESQGDIKQA